MKELITKKNVFGALSLSFLVTSSAGILITAFRDRLLFVDMINSGGEIFLGSPLHASFQSYESYALYLGYLSLAYVCFKLRNEKELAPALNIKKIETDLEALMIDKNIEAADSTENIIPFPASSSKEEGPEDRPLS